MRTDQRGALVWADHISFTYVRQNAALACLGFLTGVCVRARTHQSSQCQARLNKAYNAICLPGCGVRLTGELHPEVGLGDHGHCLPIMRQAVHSGAEMAALVSL